MELITIMTERLRYQPMANLVAFADTPTVLEVHPQLLAAADIIQARFYYIAFLLEACPADSREELAQVPGVFEVSLGSGLFCVPLAKRGRLKEAEWTVTNFGPYTWLFDALRSEEPMNVDEVWEAYAEAQGLICFRLILR